MIEINITGDTAADVLDQLRGLTQPDLFKPPLFKGPLPSGSQLAAAAYRGLEQFGKNVATEYAVSGNPNFPLGQVAKPEFVTAQQEKNANALDKHARTAEYVQTETPTAAQVVLNHPSGFTEAEIAASRGTGNGGPPIIPNPFSAMQHAIDSTAPRLPTLGDIAGSLAMPRVPFTFELDTQGLPWDARIHAGTRSKNADGKWKVKRGLDPAALAPVEAELREAMSAPSVPQPPATPVIPLPPGVPLPPPPPSTGPGPFQEMIAWLTPEVTAQRLTFQQIEDAVKARGIANLPMLELRPDLVATVWNDLRAVVKS